MGTIYNVLPHYPDKTYEVYTANLNEASVKCFKQVDFGT